ncbi:MAG TPA: aldo/keto reductase [Anaerolineae bacterium]|jgi:aryl-alcohol dehydrogenase-like predicted oxidoreductase
MEYRKFGRTGLKVSELCLGTMTFLWTSDEPTSMAILSVFVAAGGNFIDTADAYSRWVPGNPGGTAEVVIGKWLAAGAVRREQVVLATKARAPMGDGANDAGASRTHLYSALHASLKRMQTDYVDLYQVHWADFETPLEETLRTLDDMVASGKVRYIGASNVPAWYLMKSLWTSDKNDYVRYESLQPHYNLMHRMEFEQELQPLCKDQNLAVIPYSPLAGGFLSGKYRRGEATPAGSRGENNERIRNYAASDIGERVLDTLESIGHSHKKSIPQTALAWLLSNPVITAPIIGASTVQQLQDSLSAVGYRLDENEMNQLNQLTAQTVVA